MQIFDVDMYVYVINLAQLTIYILIIHFDLQTDAINTRYHSTRLVYKHIIQHIITTMSIASEDIDELAVAQSLLRCGAKVFLKHNNSPGYLTKNSQWDGEYHLAYVEESYDETTNKCKIMWRRNGFSEIVNFILTSPDQVKAAIDYKTLSIQVEDDNNGQIHNAKIVDLLDGSLGSSYNTPGQVQIKWYVLNL